MARKKKVATEEVESALTGLKLTVTRAITFKLAMEQHAGIKFETMDLTASRTAHEVDADNAAAVSEELYAICKDEIESTIKAIDEIALDEINDTEDAPVKKKKRKKDEIGIEQDDLEGIKDVVKALIDAEDDAEMKDVQADIKEMAKDLNDSQLDYLRTKYTQKAKKLKA